MSDQAFKLRRLAETALPEGPIAARGRPMVVVAGGRRGVGTTTVAVNLAAVLADRGERVVLVDAAQQEPKVAEVAGAGRAMEKSVANVLSGDCSVAEALAPGPCGSLLLAQSSRVSVRRGSASRRDSASWAHADFSRRAQQRLLGELEQLGSDVDVVVVDSGSSLTAWSRHFWHRGSLVVLVTTTDDLALVDAYGLVKRSTADGIHTKIGLLANQCDSDDCARNVYARLTSSCQRFLSLSVQSLPALPRWSAAATSGDDAHPRVWEMPNSAFGHGAVWLGGAVSEVIGRGDVGTRGAGAGPARARRKACA